MVNYIFQDLSKRSKIDGINLRKNEFEARKWFRNQAHNLRTVDPKRMMLDRKNLQQILNHNDIGRMFMFFYDPKLKSQLPFYDIFPMVFPIGFKDDGFLGINLHYLSPQYRARLMDALYTTLNNKNYDDTTKLKINYQILNKTSKFRFYAPCIKYYLWWQCRSQFLRIEPQFWDAALLLPVERFKKATNQQVWTESQKPFVRAI